MARSVLAEFGRGCGLAGASLIVEDNTVDCGIEEDSVCDGGGATRTTVKEENLDSQLQGTISVECLTRFPILFPVLLVV